MLLVLFQSLALALILSSAPSHLIESRFTVDTVLPKATFIVEARGGKAIAATNGKQWDVLVANTNGYESYRQQVDICHAYYIFKRRDIMNKHIIVLRYDDAANHHEVPKKGTLFSHPCRHDTYKGVQNDFIRETTMTKNLQAFILGDKKKIKGGCQKNKEKENWITIPQKEATIWYLQKQVRLSPEGSKEKAEAQKVLKDELAHKKHINESILKISQILFGEKEGPRVLRRPTRHEEQPRVDDVDRFHSLVETFEAHCGHLVKYETKYPNAFVNMCNAGVDKHRMAQVASQVCKPASAPTH